MPNNFYELCWIFFIYSFLGWCTEVAYAALRTGRFINRGFLNGPYCPIYGCGVVIVLWRLTPLKDNLFILFLGSAFLTTILEFIAGFVLEKVFHNKWWDYSDRPFNIMGYVCPAFSFMWGAGCTFIMKILHPIIYRLIRVVPVKIGALILLALFIMISVDIVFTVITIGQLNKRLALLDSIVKRIRNLSDDIGESVYENAMTMLEKAEKIQEANKGYISKLENKLPDSAEIKGEIERFNKLLSQKSYGVKRLLSAFPGMKSKDYNYILNKIKEYFKE